MLGYQFHHKTLSKYTITLAKIFSDVQIERKDRNGVVTQRIHVPISEGPPSKWLAKLSQFPDPETDKNIASTVPRLNLELIDVRPDSERKLGKVRKNVATYEQDSGKLKTQFTPVPFVLTYNLHILARYVEDMYDIIEQIYSFFTPDFTVTVNTIPEMNIKRDVPFTIVSSAPEDIYEGAFEDRRIVSWLLNIEAKIEFYGPITKSNIIKRAQVDFHAQGTGNTIENTPRHARYVVVPGLTANGTPTSNASASLHYNEIDADDDYDFIETFYHFDDFKKYDPETGLDYIIPSEDDDTIPPPGVPD